MIVLHAFIALAGLALTTYAYFRPSPTVLRISYGLAASTLATGIVLTVMSPSHLMQACITGLIYFAFVTFGIVAAQRKLAAETISRR